MGYKRGINSEKSELLSEDNAFLCDQLKATIPDMYEDNRKSKNIVINNSLFTSYFQFNTEHFVYIFHFELFIFYPNVLLLSLYLFLDLINGSLQKRNFMGHYLFFVDSVSIGSQNFL